MTRLHLLFSLLFAHLACGLHFLCLLQRAFYDFLRYDPLPEADVRLLRSVDNVMSITHFPSFQMMDLEITGIPSMFTCIVLGYAVGFSLGYFLSPQIVRFKFTTFIWWLCLAIVVSDIRLVIVLAKTPAADFFLFLRIELIMAVVVAIVLGIVFGIAKLDRWLLSLGPREE